MNTASRIAGWLVGCLWLLTGAVCLPSPPVHKALPVMIPFPMDKAGQTARIEFSIVEGQANLKRRFMVALDFPQTENDSIENVIQQKNVPLQIQVFAVDQGKMVPIQTEDDQTILAVANGVRTKSNPSLAKLSLYGTDGKTSNVLVAGFYLSHYGHYVAVVKTVQNFPMFSGIKTELKVDQFYNPGE